MVANPDSPASTAADASAEQPGADQPGGATSTSRAAFDPLMVVARVGGSYAVWQVETDPEVTLGDFSGAWLVGPEGIHGFAAGAEWLPERADRGRVLAALLRYQVLLAGDLDPSELSDAISSSADPAPGEDGVSTDRGVEGQAAADPVAGVRALRCVDVAATDEAVAGALRGAKELFAELGAGKKQPAWGAVRGLGEVIATARAEAEALAAKEGEAASAAGETKAPARPLGLDDEQAAAAQITLGCARELRKWIREWVAFDKVRVRRLGPLSGEFKEPARVPVAVLEA